MTLVSRFGVGLAALLLAGCASSRDRETTTRIEALKKTNVALHERFEIVVARDPTVASAVADEGGVILGIRSGLVEELAGNVAASYLDHVMVDLGKVRARARGEIEKGTFLGRVSLGKWSVSVELGSMVGYLRAGQPQVSLRPPDRLEVVLPVDVEESEGDATFRFRWDSSGVVNAVCRDFESRLAIKGRVLAQQHQLSGGFELRNTGDTLTATPMFPDRRIQLRLDLLPDSWLAVERVLRSEDALGKCGLFMDPKDGLKRLRALAEDGISVRLPDSIFKAVHFPARLQESVMVNHRPVGLSLSAGSLRVETATLWSSVMVAVEPRKQP